jgi:hypothetical protein
MWKSNRKAPWSERRVVEARLHRIKRYDSLLRPNPLAGTYPIWPALESRRDDIDVSL